MSIKYNNKIIAGKYKEQIIPFANTTEAGIAKIATQEEINEGVDNTSIVTPVYLSKKQNKLTAGEGISIDATNTISSKILPDKVTIIENDDKTISTVARKTVNKNIIFDWEGTQVEYQQALRNGEIKPDWYCYITDDEEIVDFTNIPNTSLNNLTQDGINTINNIVDERADIKLNNKLDLNLGNLDDEGNAILNNKANIDLTNLSTQGQNILNYKLNKSQISNCITEIPQRIKYTFENGTFTLKAGSVVTVPNGAGNFEHITINQDLIRSGSTGTGSDDLFVYYNKATNSINTMSVVLCYSGATAPTLTLGQYALWYDTTNNIIKLTNNTGSTWTGVLAFPIAQITRTTGTMTGVKEVFNGIGYIGSTVWCDKDIKALLANGRNEDGTLRSIEVITSTVLCNHTLNTGAKNITAKLALDGNNNPYIGRDSDSYYDFNTNHHVRPDSLYKTSTTLATVDTSTTGITKFNAPKAFMAVDYNSSKTIIKTYQNGTSWYRVYSDGWCEQGGVSTGANDLTVTLLKPYKDTNYSVLLTYLNSTSSSTVYIKNMAVWDKTVNSFKQRGADSSVSKQWEAKGYI